MVKQKKKKGEPDTWHHAHSAKQFKWVWHDEPQLHNIFMQDRNSVSHGDYDGPISQV